MATMQQKILNAWQARVNSQWELCRQHLSELKHALQIPNVQIEALPLNDLMKRRDSAFILDVLTLQASVLAEQGGQIQASTLLQNLEQAAQSFDTQGFFLCYERGRVAFRNGDYNHALESFERASLLAAHDLAKLWATVNIVFCLENLGLPYSRCIQQVKHLVGVLGSKYAVDPVLKQLEGVRMRECFRAGSIREAIAVAQPKTKDLASGQTFYLGQWLSSLPYHSGFNPPSPAALSRLADGKNALLFRSFRMRTLQGMLHPEDLSICKPSEIADRIYLWVWRWLSAPQDFSATKLTALVTEVRLTPFIHRFTVEDRQLLRNALLWISLFNPAAQKNIQPVLELLRTDSANDSPLFQIEFLVIKYFTALRDANSVLTEDFYLNLKDHALWKSDELYFKQLVEKVRTGTGSVPTPLNLLVSSLKQLLNTEGVGKGKILVDVRRQQITDRNGATVLSKAVVDAFYLLHKQPSVSCEVFAKEIFGLTRFDSLIHNSKIFNLLARMKSFSEPTLTFGMKQGRVFARGEWSELSFREDFPLPEFPDLYAREIHSSESLNGMSEEPVQRMVWQGALSRGEIQARLKRPRSTTNRILTQWLTQGWIRREGNARRTRYWAIEPIGTQGESRV